MRERLAEAIGRIAEYRDVQANEIDWECLSGLTNVSYLARFRDVELVVRFPGDGTDDFIDRQAEVANSQAAHRAGLTNGITFFDPRDSVLISEMVRNARPLAKADRQVPGVLERAVEILKRTHEVLTFENDFNPFALLAIFTTMADGAGAQRSVDLDKATRAIEPLRPVLESTAAARVSCHNDPVPENFLDTGSRLLLIDWEYSGRNDPAWDLASLSLEWDLSPAQERDALVAYGSHDGALPLRVAAYRPVADLVWSVWATVQTAGKHGDFTAYGEARLDRCLRAISAPAFAVTIDGLRSQ